MQLRPLRVVNNLAVFAITYAKNLAHRLPVRILHHRMVELATGHTIDVITSFLPLIWLDVPMRANKSNLHPRIHFFNLANQFDVALKTNRRGKQNQELIVFADFHRLLPVHFVRRSVEQPAPGDHPGRIGQPNRIPIRFNLSRRGPPRTGPAVEILETRRVQQQSLHRFRHSSPSAFERSIWRGKSWALASSRQPIGAAIPHGPEPNPYTIVYPTLLHGLKPFCEWVLCACQRANPALKSLFSHGSTSAAGQPTTSRRLRSFHRD